MKAAALADRPPAGEISARNLRDLRDQARTCTRCPLHLIGTQTVFGEGPSRAPLLILGEVPGDREDLTGRPFVGPAGRLLDKALSEAGIVRSDAYLTNAVKHFKWVRAGKRRLHKKPNATEIRACRPWLEHELGFVRPHILLALGATAAQSILGPSFRITQGRGKVQPCPFAPVFLATYHPSAILRAPDQNRELMMAEFRQDLGLVATQLKRRSSPG